jgi:hypothetical protein
MAEKTGLLECLPPVYADAHVYALKIHGTILALLPPRQKPLES